MTEYCGVSLDARWKHLQTIKAAQRESGIEKPFDDFDRKRRERFDAINNRVHSINQVLREAV